MRTWIVLMGVIWALFVRAQPHGGLQGTVKTTDGRPLPGATVLLEPDRHLILTDEGGNFTFDRLFPGTYILLVTHTGYEPYRDSATIRTGNITRQHISLKEGNDQLDEVTITGEHALSPAPDNLIKADRAAMPVQVITRRTMELMGSRRLDEVLKEQTGMAIVNNIGGGSRSVGVQMQGFGSEYVMILIDGQPMVGRNNGNFDLSRISVANIERIEIIKGASSCLFGSEAMGGAVNIITRHGALQPQALASLSYGSLRIVDATLEGETPFHAQRGSVNLSGNYYRTDGFSTNPYLVSGTTSPPYDNIGLQGRARYRLTKNSTAGVTARYGVRTSYMPKDWGGGLVSDDSQDEKDLNLSATFDQQFRHGIRSMSRYYFTRYTADESVRWRGDQQAVSQKQFGQAVHRAEQQFAYSPQQGLNLTGGLGGSVERMDDSELQGLKNLSTAFAYIQGDWALSPRLEAVGGLRFDYTNSYGSKVNPSLGLQYRVHESLILKAGFGTGFKAPDFRMRYLIFFNPTANYLVVGNDRLGETLANMQQNGQISEIRKYLADRLEGNLQSERSASYNLGALWKPAVWLKAEVSAYYHQLSNQINPVLVATGTAISQIYSYQNLPQAVNKGLEASVAVTPLPDLELSAGYQYLLARDLSVADSIRSGNWPFNQNIHNPATGESFPPQPGDYWGIENRSRHMLNIRAFYTYHPLDLSANIRLNYRGKYPFMDYNGNEFIDRFDLFVPQHTLVNASVEKKLADGHISLRFTADNLLDFKHQFMPGQPGRVFLAGVTYRFF